MNAIFNFISPEFVEAFGWTIIHSLWQGILVTGAIVVVFSLMHRNSAQVKYLIGYFGLLLMLGWSALTFTNAYEYANEKNVLKQNMISTPGFAKVYLEEHLSQRAEENETVESAINLNLIKLRSFFQRNFHIVLLFWIAGFLFLVFRMAGGLLYNYKLRTRRLIVVDEKWMETLRDYADRLKINRKVEAFFSPLVKSPLTLGVFKPVILFPVAAFTGLSVKDVEAVLAHELAHIVRRDYLFNIIQSVIGLIYFYHPAMWLISSLINAERENSCDNIAIGLTGDRKGYIRTLAQTEINRAEYENLAMAFASRRGSVLSRIKHIQKQKAMKTNFIEGLIAAAVVVTGFMLVSFTVGNSVHTQILPNEGPVLEVPEGRNEPVQKKEWTEQEIDSLKNSVEKQLAEKKDVEEVSEEMERMVEVAMSENDPELQAEIMAEINRAMAEIDIDAIVREAMHEASVAIKEAQVEIREARVEIDSEEIRRDMEEARRDMEEAHREIEEARREVNEEMRRELENAEGMSKEMIELSIQAANAGIDIASAVVNSIDIDAIVNGALNGVGVALDALSEIDIDSIEANDSLTQGDIDELKQLLEEKEEEIKAEKKKLKEKEKELKRK
ncbi:MAG: M48 family metalloprotease [Prolixibacteraceae bacterium]|jgi:bla regulator protein BlaR1|nr:M48 family metalloprotease [Prolixibacteraceae bacterium]